MKCLWEGDLKSAECLAPTARSGTGGLEWAHCDFEERLREWMTAPAPQKKIILVRGFPGSGKKWLFHSLAARPILTWPNPDDKGFRTVTESVEIRTLKDYKPLRDRWISQKIRGLRRRMEEGKQAFGLLLVYDHVLDTKRKSDAAGFERQDQQDPFDDPKVLLLSQLCIHSESWDRIVVAYFMRIWIWISRS